ncbi:PRC-barrel domain-containing protein [Haloflavibacter putidus]|uniref:PRC-barrel domain-containing protein n=1 Tax=Haloflavibacter putidus TaxID=2576776 RepID=UPI001F30E4D1|nr:PRC-barrel domain-containing protein [Haloflavibacter putidus]
MKNKKKHLYYLEELSDYKVAGNYSDVRGWSVKDSDNRVIGKVENLLVNKDMERVVYLDVEVDETIIEADHDPYGKPANADVHEFVNKEGENHIIIPIGLIDINESQKFVYTNSIDHQTFAETKRIKTGATIDREYEEAVMRSYKRDRDADTGSHTEKERRHGDEMLDNNDVFSDSQGHLTEEKKELNKERERLAEERRKLEKQRKELEEERRKLEEERKLRNPDYRSTPNPDRSREYDASDKNAFYKGKEFDDSNYRSDQP